MVTIHRQTDALALLRSLPGALNGDLSPGGAPEGQASCPSCRDSYSRQTTPSGHLPANESDAAMVGQQLMQLILQQILFGALESLMRNGGSQQASLPAGPSSMAPTQWPSATASAAPSVAQGGQQNAKLIAQGDFPNVRLPGGATVARVGCMAASFMMAARHLGLPAEMNQQTINKMGFQGNLLVRGNAAPALGMKQRTESSAGAIMKHLQQGGAAVIPVKGEGHWVTLRMGADGTLQAMDPAGGKLRNVSIQNDRFVVDGYAPGVRDYMALSRA